MSFTGFVYYILINFLLYAGYSKFIPRWCLWLNCSLDFFFISLIIFPSTEKKLLQKKLRNASANGKSLDVSKSPIRKDVSTSTEDLGMDVFFLICIYKSLYI